MGVPRRLDFIGRVEQFDLDFKYLLSMVGMTTGREIESKRVSGVLSWAKTVDEKLYSMIREFYHDDIELLTRLFPHDYGLESSSYSGFLSKYGCDT
jgi:hypothetical protein